MSFQQSFADTGGKATRNLEMNCVIPTEFC